MDPYQASSDAPQTATDDPMTVDATHPVPPGANLIAATVEPPPHKSTKIEVTELKDPEVKDFGWNVPPRQVPAPLVHGLGNEDIYTLIRRFNKASRLPKVFVLEKRLICGQQVFHVKAVPHDPGLLDLEVSEEEEFSPDKLRATLERIYMTVVCVIRVCDPETLELVFG
jgi:hypothetical protein